MLGRDPESDAAIESSCKSRTDLKDLVEVFLASEEYRRVRRLRLESEDVRWAYRTILGRDPESEAVIELCCGAYANIKSLVEFLLGTEEGRLAPRSSMPGKPDFTKKTLSHLADGSNRNAVAADETHPPYGSLGDSAVGMWPEYVISVIWGKHGLQESMLLPLPAPQMEFPDGWTSQLELRSLYNLAVRCPGPVLEVGPWIGRSTTAICLGLKDRSQPRVAFDTIDFGHTGVDEWTKAFGGLPTEHAKAVRFLGPLETPGGSLAVLIAKLRANKLLNQVTTIVRGDFLEMPLARTYSLIFCDTTHNEEEVRRNVPKLASHANSGAVMVFDDVMDNNFADIICGYLPPSRRVLLQEYHQYSKYLLVKLDQQ
jgi:hypothetical protein